MPEFLFFKRFLNQWIISLLMNKDLVLAWAIFIAVFVFVSLFLLKYVLKAMTSAAVFN